MPGALIDRLPRPGGRIRLAALCALGTLLLGTMALPAIAETDPEAAAEKAYWQKRYASLLDEAEVLRETVERERELYADANRRNYRRGDKRHRHRKAMLEAAARLEVVERELEALPDEARRAGALPGWLREVELERE